jgi:hypothetical protein
MIPISLTMARLERRVDPDLVPATPFPEDRPASSKPAQEQTGIQVVALELFD